MKKLITLTLTTAICLGFAACTEGDVFTQQPNEETSTETTVEVPRNRFTLCFKTGSANEIVEPEISDCQMRSLDAWGTVFPKRDRNYAGAWVDKGRLHLLLTSDAPEVLDRYRRILKDYADIVVLEIIEGGYSYNSLRAIMEVVIHAFAEYEAYRFVGCGVCEKENQVHLQFLGYNETMRVELETVLLDLFYHNEVLSVTRDLFVFEEGIIAMGLTMLPEEEQVRNPQNERIIAPDVRVIIREVTPVSMLFDIANDSDEYHLSGHQYYLSRKTNNNWEVLEYIADEIVWFSTLAGIAPHTYNEAQQPVNWETLYGTLPAGKYKYTNGNPEVESELDRSFEFTIA